jgi:hypothetical protein
VREEGWGGAMKGDLLDKMLGELRDDGLMSGRVREKTGGGGVRGPFELIPRAEPQPFGCSP